MEFFASLLTTAVESLEITLSEINAVEIIPSTSRTEWIVTLGEQDVFVRYIRHVGLMVMRIHHHDDIPGK